MLMSEFFQDIRTWLTFYIQIHPLFSRILPAMRLIGWCSLGLIGWCSLGMIGWCSLGLIGWCSLGLIGWCSLCLIGWSTGASSCPRRKNLQGVQQTREVAAVDEKKLGLYNWHIGLGKEKLNRGVVTWPQILGRTGPGLAGPVE